TLNQQHLVGRAFSILKFLLLRVQGLLFVKAPRVGGLDRVVVRLQGPDVVINIYQDVALGFLDGQNELLHGRLVGVITIARSNIGERHADLTAKSIGGTIQLLNIVKSPAENL